MPVHSNIPSEVWLAAEAVYPTGGVAAALRVIEANNLTVRRGTLITHMNVRGIKRIEPSVGEVAVPEQESAQVIDLRRALVNVQRQLARANERTDALVAATIEAARDATLSIGPVPAVPRPQGSGQRRHGNEAALWHLTDWQGAKVTTSYNSEVMRERVMRFCEKARSITEIQRADHPVTHCIVGLGGDMIEGLFQFPTQPYEIDSTLFGQYVTVARLIGDVVRFALSAYETVEVIAEWGNHGRIGSKRDAVPRADNFDRMCYELARQLLAGEDRLTWADCPEDIQRIEFGNYRALLCHGDEIGRNGFAAPATIVQHVNRWRSGAYPWDFRDVYTGHYHTHAEWPLANGRGSVYQTGSVESDNRYAGVMLAAASSPSQRLHFIDPVKGRVTAAYKIWLAE